MNLFFNSIRSLILCVFFVQSISIHLLAEIDGAELIDGSVSSSKIADDAIKNSHIHNNSIDGKKIKNKSIEGRKIEDQSLTGRQLRNNTIEGKKIADGTIDGDKLKKQSITGSLIADQSIHGKKIKPNSIGTNKIKNQSITTDKIANNAITAELIADGSIPLSKLSETIDTTIASESITSDKIANDAVTNNKLADNSVSSSKIGYSAITNSHLANNSVNTSNINNNAITTNKIVDGNVTSSKISSGAIDNTHLSINAVNTSNISDNAVTSAKVTNGAISANKVEGLTAGQFIIGTDGTAANNAKVTMSGDASMNSSGVLTIGSNAVIDTKIASEAITEPKLKALDTPNDGEVLSWNNANTQFEWVASGSPVPASMIVDASGNGDFTDLTVAINALPSTGGHIYIKPGTYTLNSAIALKNNTHLEGSTQNQIIINRSVNTAYLSASNVNNIIIENLDFTNSVSSGRYIRVANCDNINIKSCDFDLRGFGPHAMEIIDSYNIRINHINIIGDASGYGYGVLFDNSDTGTPSNLWIENSTFTNIQQAASECIWVEYGLSINILNNKFIGNTRKSILFNHKVSQGTIMGNSFINCNSAMMFLGGSSDMKDGINVIGNHYSHTANNEFIQGRYINGLHISSNYISRGKMQISETQNLNILGNTINDYSGTAGIYLTSAVNEITINGNSMSNNFYAINSNLSNQIIISDNNFNGNQRAIYLNNYNNAIVSHNIFKDQSTFAVSLAGTSTNSFLDGNIFKNNVTNTSGTITLTGTNIFD